MTDSIRLLLVEDEPTVLTALRKFFLSAGARVDCARELEEAEALIATTDYDAVIADLRLSPSSAAEGLEVVRFVHRASRHTRVIVLSAYGTPQVREDADALGAAAFIAKPAPLPQIAETVSRVLGRPL